MLRARGAWCGRSTCRRPTGPVVSWGRAGSREGEYRDAASRFAPGLREARGAPRTPPSRLRRRPPRNQPRAGSGGAMLALAGQAAGVLLGEVPDVEVVL